MNEKIRATVEQVLASRDVSIAAVRGLEAIIVREGCAPELQELLDVLASYQPGGGEFLFDADALLGELRRVMTNANAREQTALPQAEKWTERRLRLERLLFNELALDDLQLWVYGDESLRDFFGADLYDELLNVNYVGSTASRETNLLLSAFFDATWPGRLERLRIVRICDDLIAERETLRGACAKLAQARYAEPLVPVEFAGIDSEFDDLPSHTTNPAEKERFSEFLNKCRPVAIDAAKRLRAALMADLDETTSARGG